MDGKTCLITGANGGIGYETARALGKMGVRIIMVARNEDRGAAARQRIILETGATVDLILGDLSLIEETKRVAHTVKEQYSQLDLLINNAGGVYAKRTVTPEGVESTFALNVLAPFVLTLELLDLLRASVPSRIINVSSSAHKSGRVDLNDLQHEQKFSRMKAYASTKLALNLLTFELARRLEGTGITCNALNPGFVNTRPSYASGSDLLIGKILSPFGKSPEQGAVPSIWAASAPELEGVSGKYFNQKCQIVDASQASYDRDMAVQLWNRMVELTGVSAEGV